MLKSVSSVNVCLFLFLTSSFCELCFSADKVTNAAATPHLIKLMSSLQKQDSVNLRSRRSYIDNRIDTFPPHPAYRTYHGEYPFQYSADADLEYPMTRSYTGAEQNEDMFAPIRLDQFTGLNFGGGASDLDGGDLGDLDLDVLMGKPLPKKINLDTHLPPEAKEMRDDVLSEFLTYMELKESGDLEKCLASRK